MIYNPGDLINWNGKNLRIASRYASGAHMRYVFEDGTEALDLIDAKLIINDKIKRIFDEKAKTKTNTNS